MGFKAHYARQGSVGWQIDSWDVANQLLSYLSPEKRAYATFTRTDGSYVQCAGSKSRLTVEVRVIDVRGGFEHYVLGRGAPVGRETKIDCSIGPIAVDVSQVLDLRAARRIIRVFVEDGTLHPNFVASDVTAKFADP